MDDRRMIMETRFKKKSQIIDIGITAVAAVLSVGIMLYGISHFGLGEAWPELVLNLCYRRLRVTQFILSALRSR